MSRWVDGAKFAALTGWLVLANWALQGQFSSRADAVREGEWQRRARSLVDGNGTGQKAASLAGARVEVLMSGRRAVGTVADEVDHAVRREGIAAVRLLTTDDEPLYWVVLELVRRGYDDDELRTLLNAPQKRAEWRDYR